MSIEIVASRDTLLVGDTIQLRAVVLDNRGDTIRDAKVEWISWLAQVASIDTTGRMIALVPGQAEIYAKYAGLAAEKFLSIQLFGPDRPMKGHYGTGFEFSGFRECGDSLYSWVSPPAAVYDFMRSKPEYADPNFPGLLRGTVYVEWMGRRSGLGQFGHLGGFRHQVFVSSLQLVRATSPSDCTSIGS